MRVGTGYDVHRLVEGRRLVLGGMDVPSERGLLGWSDGDVLVHAIIDALLGAAGLGDIGRSFPPGDPQYRDISSIVLLERVKGMLDDSGWRIENVDATLICEEPRLSPFFAGMVANIAGALGVDSSSVSIKAKTNEGLGFIGRGEGIASHAVALIQRRGMGENI